MKALTICQPYAELIVQGRKTCENRTWHTNHRGRMYIHAGKSREWFIDDEDLRKTCGRVPAFGAVVAIVEVVACLHRESARLDEWVRTMNEEQRGHVRGPYCWIFANVKAIEPVVWRGGRGLFDIDAAVLEAAGGVTCDARTSASGCQ